MSERTPPMVASQLVPALVRRLIDAGHDPAALSPRFAACDRTPEAAVPDATMLPMAEVRALSELAATVLDDPFIGLHAAAAVPRGGYGVVEFAGRNAPDLRRALERAVRYHRLIHEHVAIALETSDAGAVTVEHHFLGDPLGVGRHGNEFTSAILLRVMRDAVGQRDATGQRDVAPRRLWFAHPRPPRVDALARFFGTGDIEFGRETNGLVFDADVLDLPIPDADRALLPILDRHAAMLLPAATPPADLLGRIREQIRLGLSEGASVEATAAALRMSVRTLQRRLGELGTSFRVVLDGVRAETARAYVEDRRLSLGEVAFLLGYSDTRAFLRAFKRWTGESPQRYRRAAGRA